MVALAVVAAASVAAWSPVALGATGAVGSPEAGGIVTPDGQVLPNAGVAGTAVADRQTAPATDDTVTRIAVRADGSARWTVRIRTRLETDEEVEDYRTFQGAFRNDTASYREPFAERIGGVVANSANTTGREMEARNVTATTSIQELPRRWGVVSFSFTWTNFARLEGDGLAVGDVFEGGFLLAANDSMVVAAPSGYVVASADPEPDDRDDGAATWEGRRDFGDRRPRVRMVPASTPTATPTPTTTPTDATSSPWPPLPLSVVLVAVLAGGVYLWRRSGAPLPGGGGGSWREGPSAAGGGAADAGGDQPVLTDGERVERLLADADGRMKQAAVAEELGWSDSKTSRVVADLVEDGRVEKLRLGRENVLDLVEAPD